MARSPSLLTTSLFQEANVRALLAGSPDDIARALACIDHHLRPTMCRWLRSRFPELTAEDVADVWGETLLCVLNAARQGRFRPDRSLLAWLCKIARARAIDLSRRHATGATALQVISPSLTSSTRRRSIPAAIVGDEILALVQRLIATLPPRQRLVLATFVEHYPQSTCLEVLRQRVALLTGVDETSAAVVRSLHKARCKLRRFLLQHGYAPDSSPP